jgi:hypothetical protein
MTRLLMNANIVCDEAIEKSIIILQGNNDFKKKSHA